ncbi:MAG: hypothetical protein WDO74_30895 [Pseudomonadota bacterium]
MPEGGATAIFGFPPLVHGPLFASLIWLLSLALGRRLTVWLRLSSSTTLDTWERGLVALTLGAGSLQLVPFLLAEAHLMTPRAVRGAVLLLAALLIPDGFLALVGLRRALAAAWKQPLPTALRVWAGMFACLLALLLVHTLVFAAFGDDDGYHLSAPARWLRDGTLSYLPSYTHTNASFGFEMLYVIALSFGEAIGAKLLHFGAGVWTLLAIVLCCRRLGSSLAGICAISFLMIATPITNLPQVFSLAFADLAAAWAAMVSVLVWLAWREKHESVLLTCLALCAGFTGSFKFTALPIGLAWAVAILAELRIQNRGWKETLALLARYGVIAALPVLPWLLRNWQATGNPIYPMLASVIPTRDWPAEHGQLFSRYVRYFSWGIAPGSRLNEGMRQGLLLLTGLLLVGFAAALWSRTRRPALRILIALALLYTLQCVALTGLLSRYWLPGTACFSMVGFVLLEASLPRTAMKHAVAQALITIALAVQLRLELKIWPRLPTDLRLATGLSTGQQERASDPIWQMWGQIRSKTPEDARILVVAFYNAYGASSFGCFPFGRTCFTTDSHLQHTIRFDSWHEFLASIERANIQYLLIPDHSWRSDRRSLAFVAGQNEYPFCDRLASDFGERISKIGELSLYRLRPIRPR